MRRPTLSPSKITTYLACPTKYRWTYLDDRGKWYLRSKSYFSFGTSLHQVLQRYHDASDTGVTTTEEAIAALEESWIDAGYGSQDEMMQALAEGKSLVKNYTERIQKEPVTSETIYIEKLIKMDLGAFILQGRVDRVDELPDGSLEVVDYKSKRSTVTEEDIKFDVAMGIYQLILEHLHPHRPVLTSIIALQSGDKASVSLTPEEISKFREDIISIGDEMLNRDWENHRPAFKPLCHSCDFLPLCRKDPEFDYAAPEPVE